MKKIVLTGLVIVNFAVGSELKAYYDRLYPHIRQCVLQEIDSQEIYKPVLQLKTKKDIENYLKALDLPKGYYVVIDTTPFSSKDVCFLELVIKQLGHSPKYYQPAEKIVVDVFQRKQDAVLLKKQLKNKLKLNREVSIFDIF